MSNRIKIQRLVKRFQNQMEEIVNDPGSGVTKITIRTTDGKPVVIAKKKKKRANS